MINKKGASKTFNILLAVVIGFGWIILIFFLIKRASQSVSSLFSSAASAASAVSIHSFADLTTSVQIGFLDYIFGPIPDFGSLVTNAFSPAVLIIAMWFFFFFTFGDIISTFSTFKPWISWMSAFLLTLMMANLKFIFKPIIFFTYFFSYFGAVAVILGLGTAVVAFLLVNFGVRGAGTWLMERKMMNQALRARIETEANAEQVVGAVKGMKNIAKALRENS